MHRYRYLIAVVAVAGAALARLAMDPMLGRDAPMLIFVMGVSFASVTGGLASGIVATLLSIPVGLWLFIAPRYALLPTRSEDWVRIAVFLVEGILIAFATGRIVQRRDVLEKEVQERTSELQASNEALERFAYTISHDLRAPLRSMRGFAEILQEDHGASLHPDARGYVGRIVAAAHRLEELVQNLLAYARVNHGEIPVEPVSLQTAVRAALAQLEAEVRSSGAHVTVDSTLDGSVTAHRETLEMMLTNLVSNGLKYVPRERVPELALTTRRVGDAIRLSVRDNGIGIAPEAHARIFGAFERLHARDGYPGTGLGLAIVARGAERMNGRYGVDSDGSHGSEFWIELPAAPTEAMHGSPDPAR
jgi:signal transduction histidine kinase